MWKLWRRFLYHKTKTWLEVMSGTFADCDNRACPASASQLVLPHDEDPNRQLCLLGNAVPKDYEED